MNIREEKKLFDYIPNYIPSYYLLLFDYKPN